MAFNTFLNNKQATEEIREIKILLETKNNAFAIH